MAFLYQEKGQSGERSNLLLWHALEWRHG